MLPRISYTNEGIAYTVNDGKEIYIEMNQHLCKYPELYLAVLEHELEHVERGNTKIDFWIDLKMLLNLPLQWKLFLFTRKYPGARSSHKIFFKEGDSVAVNWFSLILFSFQVLLLLCLIFLLLILLGVLRIELLIQFLSQIY